MLAYGHGQIWNAAPIAASLGITEPTVREYLKRESRVKLCRNSSVKYVAKNRPNHEKVKTFLELSILSARICLYLDSQLFLW